MKKMRSAAAIAMAVGLGLNGATHAQISQNGPYYSTPAWDQQLPASSRWVILTNWNNQAVLDRETGLVWQQSPGTAGNEIWGFSIVRCLEQTGTGGRSGWRLPSAEEIMTLWDPVTSNLAAGSPFTLPSSGTVFWTTTTFPGDNTSAFVLVLPGNGPVLGLAESTKSATARAWCVRGYQGTQSPQ